ncbi:Os05g0214300 [Oryza sativa Japonica Group]|nr:Os05g0214300 [Oryza sativa Japonica Group]|eukprot:NP_001054926.1 Os05g0214300 [Oryza sativa Japonica Group]
MATLTYSSTQYWSKRGHVPSQAKVLDRLTFKRVIKKASVEEFSCIPYILALFSCLTYSWYGFPVKQVMLMASLILAVFCMTVFFSSFSIHNHHIRKVFVGSVGLVSSISMYGSPLVAMKQVIRTKSVEFMPFYLSLFTLFTSLTWMAYGVIGRDPFIATPNCIGSIMGILQLVVYCIYSKCKEAPKVLHDIEQANVVKIPTSHVDTKGHNP